MKSRQIRWFVILTGTSLALTSLVMGQSLTVSVSTKGAVIVRQPDRPDPDPGHSRRPVDLVICLDTSGSMTALIGSARARLWDIVNELATMEPTPALRVGLLTYGSPNRSTGAQGWIVRRTDLTNDLDTVYARMMEMTTHGGDEFVGWVLNDAVHTMSWSPDPEALKLIFVAGNESADQAAHRFNFRQVARDARKKGITINAIYAGNRATGIREHWDQVATHGGGCFTAIDMQAGTVQISTPHDTLLIQLNAELNATYVPFGRAGAEGKANQVAQDDNARRLGKQSISSRTAAKASPLYNNARWDLVDAEAHPDFDLSKVKKEELPVEMREMTTSQRRKYVKTRCKTRGGVQRRIQEVSRKRDEYIRESREAQAPGQASFDEAIKDAIRKQAGKKGFKAKPKS